MNSQLSQIVYIFLVSCLFRGPVRVPISKIVFKRGHVVARSLAISLKARHGHQHVRQRTNERRAEGKTFWRQLGSTCCCCCCQDATLARSGELGRQGWPWKGEGGELLAAATRRCGSRITQYLRPARPPVLLLDHTDHLSFAYAERF